MAGWQSGALGSLRGLWGTIQSAVSERATTAQLWQSIKDSPYEGTFQQVNALRSIAVQIRGAAENYAAAGPDQAIDSTMIASPPWARTGEQQRARQQYQIVVPYTAPGRPQDEISGWITTWTTALPATVAEMDAFASAHLLELDTPEEGATLAAGLQILAV